MRRSIQFDIKDYMPMTIRNEYKKLQDDVSEDIQLTKFKSIKILGYVLFDGTGDYNWIKSLYAINNSILKSMFML